MRYTGSCHCGQITFAVDGQLTQVMECNCSHCSRKGYLLWFVDQDQMQRPSPDAPLATYTFNTHVIQHHFCPTCGCAPFGFGSDPAGVRKAAINVRCLDDVDLAQLTVIPVDGRKF